MLIFWLLPKWNLFFILTDIHSYYVIQEEVIVEIVSFYIHKADAKRWAG
jgi:hypothetical protein